MIMKMINEIQYFINIIDKDKMSVDLDEKDIKSKERQLDEEIKSLWNN